MMILYWIQKIKEDGFSVLGAMYMTIMSFFGMIESNFYTNLGYILSSVLVVMKIWNLAEDILSKKAKRKAEKLKDNRYG